MEAAPPSPLLAPRAPNSLQRSSSDSILHRLLTVGSSAAPRTGMSSPLAESHREGEPPPFMTLPTSSFAGTSIASAPGSPFATPLSRTPTRRPGPRLPPLLSTPLTRQPPPLKMSESMLSLPISEASATERSALGVRGSLECVEVGAGMGSRSSSWASLSAAAALRHSGGGGVGGGGGGSGGGGGGGSGGLSRPLSRSTSHASFLAVSPHIGPVLPPSVSPVMLVPLAACQYAPGSSAAAAASMASCLTTAAAAGSREAQTTLAAMEAAAATLAAGCGLEVANVAAMATLLLSAAVGSDEGGGGGGSEGGGGGSFAGGPGRPAPQPMQGSFPLPLLPAGDYPQPTYAQAQARDTQALAHAQAHTLSPPSAAPALSAEQPLAGGALGSGAAPLHARPPSTLRATARDWAAPTAALAQPHMQPPTGDGGTPHAGGSSDSGTAPPALASIGAL